MHIIDLLKSQLQTASHIITTYLEDLSDSEILQRPAEKANIVAWQLGHLIQSEHNLLNAVQEGASPELPAGFAEIHAKEKSLEDDTSAFLTVEGYKKLHKAQRAKTLEVLSKLPETDLDRPGPENMKALAPNVAGIFALIAGHDYMHSGQLAVLRRRLGKEIKI